MAYYAGGAPQWNTPQDAAIHAQLAYQQQSGGGGGGGGYGYTQQQPQQQQQSSSAPIPPTPPTNAASITPPPSSGGGNNINDPLATDSRDSRLSRMEDRVLVTRTADEETEDGRIRNKEAMVKIRDAWVYKQIRSRVDEFTEYKQVRTSEKGTVRRRRRCRQCDMTKVSSKAK